MAFSGEFNKSLVRFGDMDIIFDEKGSRFLTMRKVQWVNNGEEPDESKAKIEIRKYTIGKDGEEITGKGVSFLTEEGPDNLVKEMVDYGFGKTHDVLESLAKREDFKEVVEHFFDGNGSNGGGDCGEIFDMRKLLDISDEIEDDEEEA